MGIRVHRHSGRSFHFSRPGHIFKIEAPALAESKGRGFYTAQTSMMTGRIMGERLVFL